MSDSLMTNLSIFITADSALHVKREKITIIIKILVLSTSWACDTFVFCFRFVFLTGVVVFIVVSLVAMFWKACVHVCNENEQVHNYFGYFFFKSTWR